LHAQYHRSVADDDFISKVLVQDEETADSHCTIRKTVQESLPTYALYRASERHHLEALGPSTILEHYCVIRAPTAGQDRMDTALKCDDVANILAIVLKSDEIDVGVPTALFTPSCNADQFCVKA
jgi:hypothetical protein